MGRVGAGKILATVCAGAVAHLVDFFFPDRCLICGQLPMDEPVGGDPLAAPFAEGLRGGIAPVLSHPVCTVCVRSFRRPQHAGFLGWAAEGGALITARGDCFRPRRGCYGGTTSSDGDPDQGRTSSARAVPIFAPWLIGEGILRVVRFYKYDRYDALALPLGIAIARNLTGRQKKLPPASIVVPVPASRRRWGPSREHAYLLARAVAEELGLPLREDLLIKVRRTKRQAGLGREGRAGNVAGAFRTSGPVSGHVLLVDDVVTTGATAASCSAELMAAGAEGVWVLAVARSVALDAPGFYGPGGSGSPGLERSGALGHGEPGGPEFEAPVELDRERGGDYHS